MHCFEIAVEDLQRFLTVGEPFLEQRRKLRIARLLHPVILHCFGNPVKNRLPATCKLAYTGQVRKNLARTGIEKSKASRYIYLQMIFNLLKRTAAAATILVALPCGTHAQEDPRHKQMQDFLHAKRSPLAEHARAFLDAADRYGLDWRLLPCLALVETGGRKEIRNNNVFGWGNGRIQFTSVAESIHLVAERLANAAPYRKKTTEDKLKAYNPRNRNYAAHVLTMMGLVGPVAAAAATVEE